MTTVKSKEIEFETKFNLLALLIQINFDQGSERFLFLNKLAIVRPPVMAAKHVDCACVSWPIQSERPLLCEYSHFEWKTKPNQTTNERLFNILMTLEYCREQRDAFGMYYLSTSMITMGTGLGVGGWRSVDIPSTTIMLRNFGYAGTCEYWNVCLIHRRLVGTTY